MFRFSRTLKLAALCASCAFVLWLLDNENRSRRESSGSATFERHFSDVESIEITLSNDQRRVFSNSASGWRITHPIAAAADGNRILALLDALERTERLYTISEAEMSLRELTVADFGLAPPRASIAVGTPRGSFSLSFGLNTPAATNEIFASIGAEPGISILDSSLLDSLLLPLEDFSDRRLCRADLRDVVRIVVERGAQEVMRLKRGADKESWKIVSPEPAAADWAEMQKFFDTLGQTRIKSFIYGGMDSPHPVLKALEQDSLAIKLYTESSPFPATVKIGSRLAGDNNCAATTDGGAVAAISADAAKILSISPGSIRDRRVLAIGPTPDISGFSIIAVSNTLSFGRAQNGDWLIEEPVNAPAEQETTSKFIAELLSLRAMEFVPAATLDEQRQQRGLEIGNSATVTFSANGVTNRLEIEFFGKVAEDEAPGEDTLEAGDEAIAAVTTDASGLAAIVPASSLGTLDLLLKTPERAFSRRFGGYALRDIMAISTTRANGSSQRFDFAPDGSMAIGGDDAETEPISDSDEIRSRLTSMARFLADICAAGIAAPYSSAPGMAPASDIGEDLAAIGLAPAEIEISIEPHNPGIPHMLITLGAAAGDSELVFGKVSTSSAIYLFPASTKEVFARNFSESYHSAEISTAKEASE